jgi:para-aminobenzoate synthetase/4-amino-4-deoxychorismate lyase
LGVFETLLVVDGQPIELDAHLARLTASLDALFGCTLPADARELVLDRARRFPLGRLRLTVTPGRERLGTELAAERVEPALAFPDEDRTTELCSFTIEGGLGGHKWADRGLLERAEAEAIGAVPLVLDSDGTVLEASRANIFAVRDGTLLTPPADGRIVAGIARGRVIQLADDEGYETHETGLSIDELLAAEEVFLTGSVRGVERVGAIDGVALGARKHVTAGLAAGLRRSWLSQRQALNLS